MMRRLKIVLALMTLVALLPAATFSLAGPPRQEFRPLVIINTSYLHQRTGPGIQYAAQGVLVGGMQLPVVGRTQDGSWWEVESAFGIGWVNGEFVLTRGNFSTVPVVHEFGLLGRPDAMVPGLPVSVFALPNPASRALGVAPSEARYPILGQALHVGTATWYWLIRTSTGLAWVEQDDMAVVGDATNVPVLTEAVFGTLAISPVSPTGVIYPPPPEAVPSAPVAPPVVVEPVVSAPLVVVAGPLAPETTTGAPSAPSAPTSQAAFRTERWIAQVTTAYADLRVEPVAGANSHTVLTRGTEMFINGESTDGSHFLVEVPGWPEGWMAKDAVRLRPSGASHTVVIVSVPQTNLRAQPDESAAVVGEVFRDQELTVLDLADGWFRVNAYPGEGWLPIHTVTIRTDSISDLAVNGPNALPQAAGSVSVPAVTTTVVSAPVSGAPSAPSVSVVQVAGTMRIVGDCFALPLVSYLVGASPVGTVSFNCSTSTAGRDAVVAGAADLALVTAGGCGGAAELPVATLFIGGNAAGQLNFCTSATPNAPTQAFMNWVRSPAGAGTIRAYVGVPGTGLPDRAEPLF